MINSIPFDEFNDFLAVMFEEERNDMLWELWISNPLREESFGDFRERAISQMAEQSETKDEREAKALQGMNEALALLGGDFIGG